MTNSYFSFGSKLDFLRCMQPRSFLIQLPATSHRFQVLTSFKSLYLDATPGKHVLCLLYLTLSSGNRNQDPSCTTKLEHDLHTTFSQAPKRLYMPLHTQRIISEHIKRKCMKMNIKSLPVPFFFLSCSILHLVPYLYPPTCY